MNPRLMIALCITSAMLTGTVGCGKPSLESSPTVDVAKLDSGNYPVVPQDVATTRDEKAGAVQESIRMAEHIPLAHDIDNRLVYGHRKSSALTPTFPPRLNSQANFNDLAPGLVAGWRTYGERHKELLLGFQVEVRVMRFTTAEQAARATEVVTHDSDAKYPPKGAVDIPGYPESRAVVDPFASVRTIVARNNYMAYTYVSNNLTIPPDPTPLINYTKSYLDRLFDSLENYRPTAADKLSEVPADVDGLLGRTLPTDGPSSSGGVYTLHAALHRHLNSELSKRAFEDAGVDLVAERAATVYRTADPGAAKRLLATFVTERADKYQPMDGPPGLPSAKCLKTTDQVAIDGRYICYFPYGRFVAELADDQPQNLYQQTAAQYKLLASGS
ncbi:DUF7373 family lipoprotein [Nocardia transvalensis]|uniref:DUF7373 family lipoprotein n=1 Tax=Nocardia transvalensis TaxID=37333 RepID=UPI00189360CC|nr:hypothetical protein [Nocardia transvalensis]MBF6327477.1 hypothetical protein [Nocardia transvalensis]